MLHLTTFGDLALIEEGKGKIPLPRKALLCVTYLAAERKLDTSREHLASLLWPGDAATGRMNFRKMIERVRFFHSEGWALPLEIGISSVNLADTIRADFDVFQSPGDVIGRLESATQLMEKTFLENIHYSGPIATWVTRRRNMYWRQFREQLVCAGRQAKSRTDWLLVREAAKLVLENAPTDEDVSELLLAAHHQISGGAVAASHQRLAVGMVKAISPLPNTVQTESSDATPLPRLVLLPPKAQEGTSSIIAGALVEDITIGLCALRNTAVVAPYTAARIRQHPDKLAQLEQHSISYVVDTSVSAEGLFVQMIFLPADAVLWAARFPLDDSSLASRRKEISQQILAAISDHIGRNAGQLTDYRYRPEVYHSFLMSSQHLNSYTLPGMRRARNAFRETLKLRGDFAPALAGLSRTFSWEWVLTTRGDIDLLNQAEIIARQAVHVLPELATAHQDLGLSLLYRGQVDESLAAFGQAEMLSPHLADALCGYADALVHASRPADGLAKINKAMSLNPTSPDDYRWIAAGANYFLENFTDAISHIVSMSETSSARRLLAASYAMSGDLSRARMHRRKAQELNPHFDLEKWLLVLPVREKWQKELYREGLLKAGFH